MAIVQNAAWNSLFEQFLISFPKINQSVTTSWPSLDAVKVQKYWAVVNCGKAWLYRGSVGFQRLMKIYNLSKFYSQSILTLRIFQSWVKPLVGNLLFMNIRKHLGKLSRKSLGFYDLVTIYNNESVEVSFEFWESRRE